MRELLSLQIVNFDEFYRGEESLTLSELNGYAIFNTEKGDCFHCHGTEMFMDNLFHNNGLDAGNFLDLGLANISGNPLFMVILKHLH